MIDDRDLDKGPEPPPVSTREGGPPLKPIAIIGVLIVVFIAGGAWWMSRRAQPVTPANTSPQAVTATEASLDKPEPPPPPLPPLTEMDAFLRPLLAALSSRPEMAHWLATDDLVRQLAMAIDQAAVGGSPARDFKILAPTSRFTTSGGGAQRTIDPASYRRYDGLIATVTSIDPAALAKVYRTIRPRLNEAYRGLGHPEGDVHRAIHNALDILIDTPVLQSAPRVHAIDARGWIYVDPDLEELAPSQKQILRMGPRHTEAAVTWLRALRDAIQ